MIGSNGSGVSVIRNVSDLRVAMHRNERPIYFISATNFNLLGIEQWVRNFKFVNYIDCFDGRHPKVMVAVERVACGIRIDRGHQQLSPAA